MRNSILVLLLMTVLVSFNSCRTKDGAPGPAGANGTNGTNGTNNLLNQGSVSGTLYYLDFKGDSVKLPFNYQYFSSSLDNQYAYYDTADYDASEGYMNLGYTFYFKRRDLNDSADVCSFSVNINSGTGNPNGPVDANDNPISPTAFTAGFSIAENLNNNLFNFSDGGGLVYSGNTAGYGTTCSISNFSLDTLTGKLMFNFVITYNPYDITPATQYDYSNPAILKGAVNVVLLRRQPSTALIRENYD